MRRNLNAIKVFFVFIIGSEVYWDIMYNDPFRSDPYRWKTVFTLSRLCENTSVVA